MSDENSDIARLRHSIVRLARLLRQQDTDDLTPTLAATLVTIERRGPLTHGELAAFERVTPPTVTNVVDRLEAMGLVERLPDPRDRRVRRVQVSAHGRTQLELNRSRRTAWLAERIEVLPAEDRPMLASVVRILEHLASMDEVGSKVVKR